jgi:hypothetical protein
MTDSDRSAIARCARIDAEFHRLMYEALGIPVRTAGGFWWSPEAASPVLVRAGTLATETDAETDAETETETETDAETDAETETETDAETETEIETETETEAEAARSLSALAKLMQSARKWQLYKVIVPSAADLGLLPEERARIVQRLGDEANLRVLEAARIPGAPDGWDAETADLVVNPENIYDVAFFDLPIVRESTLGFNW